VLSHPWPPKYSSEIGISDRIIFNQTRITLTGLAYSIHSRDFYAWPRRANTTCFVCNFDVRTVGVILGIDRAEKNMLKSK
jgi:hypothetical protein